MGWTSYHASCYKKNGNIDRKAEVEKSFNLDCCEVVKGTMVGSTYYGAIRKLTEVANGETIKLPEDKQYVFGIVVLTSVNKDDYYNFSYKDMSEDMGPYYFDCPEGILNLLTETDNEHALKWRESCRNKLLDNRIRKTSISMLKKFPLGTTIEFIADNDYGDGIIKKGDKVRLTKRNTPRNGKIVSKWIYKNYACWKQKNLPISFTVVA